jgi:valyl-tRNA synthetase
LAVVTGTSEARLEQSEADRQREQARLEKELRGLQAQLDAARARDSDSNFVGRAPEAVVDESRKRVLELEAQVAALTARRREV